MEHAISGRFKRNLPILFPFIILDSFSDILLLRKYFENQQSKGEINFTTVKMGNNFFF